MVGVKCAGVGVAKFSKNACVWCWSVRSEKLLCKECAGVPKLTAHKYSGYLLLRISGNISLLNCLVHHRPVLSQRLNSGEGAIRTRMYQTLLQTVLLAITLISIIIFHYKEDSNECWENSIGQEMYRLLLLFFFVIIILSLILETVYKLIQPWYGN